MEADISTQAVGLASSADFSLMSLFIRADIIVKSVILILIACSVYSWAVIIEKFRLFRKINQSTEEFETKFWNSKSALRHFIIIFQPIYKIQWHLFLKMQCKVY